MHEHYFAESRKTPTDFKRVVRVRLQVAAYVRGLSQSRLDRIGRDLRTVVQTEFEHHVLTVFARGKNADVQRICNVLIAAALGNHADDLLLAAGQALRCV